MRGFLSQKSGRARHLGASVGASVGLSVGISLCAGALITGPLSRSAMAAPTVGSDENGPQVQILKPGYQDVLKGRTSILIAVKTRKFNPQFVEMFIDDKPASDGPIAIGATPSAQYNWNTKLFSDGPHKLMVRVTDTQGFRGWAEVDIFINNQKKVDSAPPSLSWKNTASFGQLSGMASIEVQALDNFGVKMLMVSLKSASETDKKAAVRSWFMNRPPYIVKFDTTKVPDGLYELSAKAFDSFEQEGEAPPLTLGVVNSNVNATTVGDMLAAMARIDASNRKSATQTPSTQSTAPTDASRATATQAPAKTPEKVAPAKPKQRTVVVKANPKANAAQPSRLLPSTPPSIPPMFVGGATAGAKAPAKIAAKPKTTRLATRPTAKAGDFADGSVDAPQLSTRASATVARAASGAANPNTQNEINDAQRRERLARAATPNDVRTTGEASLSAIKPQTSSEIAGMGAVKGEPATTNSGTGRLALPSDGERPMGNAPAWSDIQNGAAPRLTPNVPLQVEAPASERAGRLSVPPTRVARAETGEGRAAPQISEFSPAPQPKISAAQGLKARLESVKTPRVGKMASPDNRLAALPRPQKSGNRGAINAITVSPLQVNVSDALPAFHVAARSTDLRAVAARYGLPVDVLAANNGWKADKTLAAGERIKLPKQLKVAYHGVPVMGDAPSMLVGGTGVTAFRFMFEMAGGKLSWDAKKQRVIARKGNSEIVLNIGSNRAKVGDEAVMMELAAFLFEGRTMVPLRFFEEGLHAQVEWDPQTGRLMVAMAN